MLTQNLRKTNFKYPIWLKGNCALEDFQILFLRLSFGTFASILLGVLSITKNVQRKQVRKHLAKFYDTPPYQDDWPHLWDFEINRNEVLMKKWLRWVRQCHSSGKFLLTLHYLVKFLLNVIKCILFWSCSS